MSQPSKDISEKRRDRSPQQPWERYLSGIRYRRSSSTLRPNKIEKTWNPYLPSSTIPSNPQNLMQTPRQLTMFTFNLPCHKATAKRSQQITGEEGGKAKKLFTYNHFCLSSLPSLCQQNGSDQITERRARDAEETHPLQAARKFKDKQLPSTEGFTSKSSCTGQLRSAKKENKTLLK